MKLPRRSRGNVLDADVYETLNQPRAFVYRAATHNVATGGAGVIIQWDTLVYDTDGMFDSTLNTQLTIRTAGLYEVKAWVLWPASAASYRQIFLGTSLSNFVVHRLNQPSAVTIVTSEVNSQLALNAGDFIQVYVAQNTGGVLTLPVSGTSSVYDHGLQACLISTI